MSNPNEILDDKKYNKLIVVLSILIPIVVAILFGVKIPNVEPLSFFAANLCYHKWFNSGYIGHSLYSHQEEKYSTS